MQVDVLFLDNLFYGTKNVVFFSFTPQYSWDRRSSSLVKDCFHVFASDVFSRSLYSRCNFKVGS